MLQKQERRARLSANMSIGFHQNEGSSCTSPRQDEVRPAWLAFYKWWILSDSLWNRILLQVSYSNIIKYDIPDCLKP